MEHLRELVGEETITYVGLSYGTMIGQMYANLLPERVRAMMLDGIVDPVAFTTAPRRGPPPMRRRPIRCSTSS